MTKVAFCAPGQGSLEEGMGREIALAVPEAMEVYRVGSEASGRPEEALLRVAARRARQDGGAAAGPGCHEPRGTGCGPGDRTRLCRRAFGWRVRGDAAANSIDTAEAIGLVRERGLAMAEAARESDGTMAAILGLDDEVVEELCAEIEGVWPANYNCPGQIVVSGESARREADPQGHGARCTPRREAQGLGRLPQPLVEKRRRCSSRRSSASAPIPWRRSCPP